MKIVRFVATVDGGSRFVNMDVPLPVSYVDEFGNVYMLSEAFMFNGVIAELPAGLDQDWYVAPNRQFVVMSGALEVQTTDGQVRRCSQGQLFMADDTQGKGHRTRVLEGPALLMFLRVPADFDAERWVVD